MNNQVPLSKPTLPPFCSPLFCDGHPVMITAQDMELRLIDHVEQAKIITAFRLLDSTMPESLVGGCDRSRIFSLLFYHIEKNADHEEAQFQFQFLIVVWHDPNNVKALFRRGLGLALSKRWNQAIVDFERALELDPNSPAKKELEVARRQVTRRIGN